MRLDFFIGFMLVLSGCAFEPTASPNFSGPGDDAGTPFDLAEPDRDASGTTDVQPSTRDMSVAPDTSSPADVGGDVDVSTDMAPDMPANMRQCDGQVVDVRNSTAHCGACGNSCDPMYGVCRGGSCECYDPYTACGADNVCTDDEYDPKNCGGCGITCGASEVCNEGQCECYPGFEDCNGECVDTDKDPRNCGRCGDSCNGDVCREGECERRNACGLTWFECPVPNAGTACVRPEANPAFCGATVVDECGSPCGPAEICYRQGAFENFQCREFRPALGCTSCPCGNCDGELCVESDEVDDVVFCVKN